MKILLTGATGFFGRNLVSLLVGHGHKVVVVCRDPINAIRRIGDDLVDDCCGNTKLDILELIRRHSDLDAIVHAATDYGRSAASPTDVFSVNVAFPVQLLEMAMSSSIRNFFNIDTFFNVKNNNNQYMGEYVLSKRQFQEWGELCGQRKMLRFVNLRLFHLYGPDDRADKFVPTMVKSCLRHAPIELTHGHQRRDFIFVEDAARAVGRVVEFETGKPAGYVHYDVGTGVSHSIREFVETLKKICSSRSILHFGALASRPGEFADARADISSLRDIGWSPKVSLESGLQATIASG